eukprot:scaffold39111_cov126-Skeletonema_marinoi.AAC.2
MSVTKWREDAVRRCKRKLDSCGGDVVERRSKKRGRKSIVGDDNNNNNNTADIAISLARNKPTKKSRRKKFAETWACPEQQRQRSKSHNEHFHLSIILQ